MSAVNDPGLAMTDQSLSPADCHRLVAVLDEVSAAAGDPCFFDQIRDSLGRHFGWVDGVVVDIPAVYGGFPDRERCSGHFHSNRTTSFLAEYVERWYGNNPFKSDAAQAALRRHGMVTLADTRPSAMPGEWAFVEQYLQPYGVADVLDGFVDADSEGAALICVYFADESDLGGRERAAMRRVTRYLAPWVRNHFTAERLRTEHALLTVRERDAAELAARGLSNREIAARLHITIDTVKKHLTRAMAKTRCDSRTQLAMRFHA